jgi:sugar-phosphatase
MSKNSSTESNIMPRQYKACLFDLDGTLIRSTHHFDDVWIRWAGLHGIDPAPILATHHGRRMEDTIRHVTGERFDAGHAMAEQIDRIIAMAATNLHNLTIIDGAKEFLHSLPEDRWAIVTSNHLSLVKSWLAFLDMPLPDVIVTADDVSRGKPDPEGYLKASAALGFAPQDCLVFEDAPAGIEAARSAGCGLMIIEGTLTAPAPDTQGWMKDYRGFGVELAG